MRHRPHLLVIEDTLELLSLLRDILEPAFEVDLASDGRAARQYLSARAYDLVILDLGLQFITAADILRFLRRESRSPHAPVLIISAASNLAEQVEGWEIQGILAKPFTIDELLAGVHGLLGRS